MQARTLYLGGSTYPVTMTNCEIYNNQAGRASTYLVLIRDVEIDNTHFYENLGSTGYSYYMSVGDINVGPNVIVDGPRCKWASYSGYTGVIEEKMW